MTDDTYKPRPGGIAERALAFLSLRGRTSARDLADGVECEHGSLHASLNMAVANGLVVREADAGITFYSLPGTDKKPDVTTVANSDRQLQAAPHEASRFECGIFSDGRMVLEIGDSVYTFTKEERARLMRFLSGVSV